MKRTSRKEAQLEREARALLRELLATVTTDGGRSWFSLILNRMKKVKSL